MIESFTNTDSFYCVFETIFIGGAKINKNGLSATVCKMLLNRLFFLIKIILPRKMFCFQEDK